MIFATPTQENVTKYTIFNNVFRVLQETLGVSLNRKSYSSLDVHLKIYTLYLYLDCLQRIAQIRDSNRGQIIEIVQNILKDDL